MTETDKQGDNAQEVSNDEVSLLNCAIAAAVQTSEDVTKDLLSTLVAHSKQHPFTWDKSVRATIEASIKESDKLISKQLSAIMQNDKFKRLEGSWLGLNNLIRNAELGKSQKVKVIDYTKGELLEQFEDAPATDRSPIFEAVYQREYGTSGGEPFGLLVGDYYFNNSDEDVALLTYIAETASVAHAPFISAAESKMFEYNSFEAFEEGRPIAAGFDSPAYASWTSFRESDESRYVTLTMPSTLSRLPYGKNGLKIKSFDFNELDMDLEGNQRPVDNSQLVWSNSAYQLALLMHDAYTASGWCTAIRGLENGGKVNALPNLVYKNDAGSEIQHCPVEVNLTDEREKELSDLGFLPLVHYKSTNFAVFIGSQTTQKPKVFPDPDATSNAAITARLTYLMASGRISHYLKIIGRDMLGSNVEAPEIQKRLQMWIDQYTNAGALGNAERSRTPLAESRIEVVTQVGKPGAYSAVAYLRPWLQLEELTVSVRMVAKMPGG